MMRRLIACLWLALASQLSAQIIVTNISVADAYVRSVDTNHNYGGAGALAVSGPIATNVLGHQEGLLDSFMRFDVSSAVSSFNSSFGVGRWVIVCATLNLFEQGAPNNTIFNRGVGPFEVRWIANDSWSEGTGNPNAPATNGVFWSDTPSILTNIDASVGVFTNGGTDGVVRATLGMPARFASELSAGNLVSFYLTATTNSAVGFTFHSHNFVDDTQWPFLEVAAVQIPQIISLLITGADVKIAFAASTGITNTVERSSNLASNDWSTLMNVIGTGGNAVIIDPGAAALPKRFYRVRLTITP